MPNGQVPHDPPQPSLPQILPWQLGVQGAAQWPFWQTCPLPQQVVPQHT
jgi:hypothetical protein